MDQFGRIKVTVGITKTVPGFKWKKILVMNFLTAIILGLLSGCSWYNNVSSYNTALMRDALQDSSNIEYVVDWIKLNIQQNPELPKKLVSGGDPFHEYGVSFRETRSFDWNKFGISGYGRILVFGKSISEIEYVLFGHNVSACFVVQINPKGRYEDYAGLKHLSPTSESFSFKGLAPFRGYIIDSGRSND